MYEAEVNTRRESISQLPLLVRKQFGEFSDGIKLRTILPWGEHCTECNWPTCYKTCELYSPRIDGACRLFVDGMVRLDHDGGLNPYILKVRFKQWGKFWAPGNLKLYSLSQAAAKERSNMIVGAMARSIPLPGLLKKRVLQKVAYVRRRAAEDAVNSERLPDVFLIECYNPNNRPIALTFTLRLRNQPSSQQFQKMVTMDPGFTRAELPVSEMVQVIDLQLPFEVEIVPNDCDGTLLYFGFLDFVGCRSQAPKTPSTSKRWKCIIWDLDNTLWDGTLVEDGPAKIRLRQGVVDVIKETDRRGILHSIASKNDADEAMNVLRVSGLDQYFLYPQINWEQKSESIARIVQLLNIGIDSVAFVDDQPFEREEVRAIHPQVDLVDSADFVRIPERSECQVPVTAETAQRRSLYQQQQQREVTLLSYKGSYMTFLKDCEIELTISPLNEENLERVYELAQRTNQMNFSGNRYPRSELRALSQSETKNALVMKCKDKFGSYGIIGFAVVNFREGRLLDLMFSCRIQRKRLEHCFLTFLLKRVVLQQQQDLYANYRPTPKNEVSGRVFEEMGFERSSEEKVG